MAASLTVVPCLKEVRSRAAFFVSLQFSFFPPPLSFFVSFSVFFLSFFFLFILFRFFLCPYLCLSLSCCFYFSSYLPLCFSLSISHLLPFFIFIRGFACVTPSDDSIP
uniref:Uncharacterized protein n=1 Tax=Rhipicephalus pulchellus TaxID=72859 RepID=L7LX61_RHIPC